LEASQGTRLKTRSFFVNDKWDFSNKLSFNLGGRYDQNIGRDGARQLVADDSKISPRLGVIYDTFGNGRLRLNASYSQYVAAIADGNVADSTSPAGSPSYLYWNYDGPNIDTATSTEFFQKVFDWFKSVGFTNNTDNLLGGGTNGIKATIPEPLESPYVGEWTIGVGTQIGTRGFFRADYINREWKNFYTTQTSLANGKVADPLAGGLLLDKTFIGTTNDFKRTYRAIQFQAAYSPWTRINIGANYTNARLRGNHGAETAGSGPITNSGVADYSEYLGYPNRNPIGWLSADQRHKLRAWVSYDQPTPIGTFNFSLLQRYDSGVPYSAIGTINPTRFFCTQSHVDGGRCTAAQLNTTRVKPNPGYAAPPSQANYYFSKRGEFRTDDITGSDLAVNWSLPALFGKAQFYVETELRNLFNESGVTNVNTTVTVLRAFDPFRDTPVEGVDWRKGANFGKPLTATTGNTQGDWQLPRTFLISAGVRF
ncbi:MAG TPA: TonB-dependent receptor, partial [Thermoanaerobaculia bacterium]|nr:TonB-dependent receptor [Thermoanaerobaculia bacterium]